MPPLVSSVNPYHRRRPFDHLVPRSNSELYRTSFFPSTTSLWNSLPQHVQEYQSISQFKRYLSSSDPVVPSYYYCGKRREQILHCKLRLKISDLNFDLYQRHLRTDAECLCGFPRETAEHFLLFCPIFQNCRNETVIKLPQNFITTAILLSGDVNLSLKQNEEIFDTVHTFISLSGRFA